MYINTSPLPVSPSGSAFSGTFSLIIPHAAIGMQAKTLYVESTTYRFLKVALNLH